MSSWDEPKQTQSKLSWVMMLGFIAVFAVGNYWQPIDWDFFGKPDGDREEQVEPDNKPVVVLETGSHVIVIEETSERKNFPFIAALQTDREYWDGLKAKGINWGFYDQDSPNVASYEADIKAAGLPMLLVVSPAGRVRLAKSLPPTTESIDEALRGIK